jgi:hypothetical protein
MPGNYFGDLFALRRCVRHGLERQLWYRSDFGIGPVLVAVLLAVA